MAEEAKDQEFLETIVKNIVSTPEAVKVERTIDEMGVLLTLKIDQSDMGYVIGKRGQTAQAIRTLLKIVGAKNNSRVNLKIYDPNAGTGVRPPRQEERKEEVKEENIDTSSVDDLNI